MKYFLTTINHMDQESFTQVFGHIFEESPDIATDTWKQGPFLDLENLHQKLVTTVRSRSPTEQIALIKKHPDLATKTKMADASVQEQTTVGLNALTEEEYHRFQELNQAYRAKFGFPFIIAVRNHDQESILQAFVTRLENSFEEEKESAIEEISKIAYFRLLDVVE